jgi:hypothetical protein
MRSEKELGFGEMARKMAADLMRLAVLSTKKGREAEHGTLKPKRRMNT